MKALNKVAIHVLLVTALVLPHQSYAYVFGTDVYPCYGFWICGEAYTVLFPYDLPSIVAAEHTINFFSSEWSDYGYDYGATSLTSTTYLHNLLYLNYPTGTFDIYYAWTLHVFLESDSNTFDEYSDDQWVYF